jgi:hypothetical protein
MVSILFHWLIFVKLLKLIIYGTSKWIGKLPGKCIYNQERRWSTQSNIVHLPSTERNHHVFDTTHLYFYPAICQTPLWNTCLDWKILSRFLCKDSHYNSSSRFQGFNIIILQNTRNRHLQSSRHCLIRGHLQFLVYTLQNPGKKFRKVGN